jgi:hypothetical protein
MKRLGHAYFQRESPPRIGKLTRRDTINGARENNPPNVCDRASCA